MSGSLRILYHHRTRGDGAEGVHINEMITAFRELGHQVELCCPRAARRPPGLSLGMTGMSLAESKGFLGWLRLLRRQGLELSYNLVSLGRLSVRLARQRPDFIYERYSPYHVAGIIGAALFRVPLVLEVNSTYGGRFPRRRLAFPRLCALMEKLALRQASVVAVVSQPLRDCVMDRGVASTRVVVTPNAVNEKAIRGVTIDRDTARAQIGVAADRVVVGFVGSLRRWHGVDALVNVIPEVLEAIPEAMFLVVGSGELEAELSVLEQRPGLEGRLLLTGGVAHEQVGPLVMAMDIGIMPDSNEWGSPMKILEYMAYGKTTVAPRYAPIQEIVEDGRTGILFQPRDQAALCHAIVRACSDQSLRAAMGQAAREYVLTQRRWTDNAGLVVDTLQLSSGGMRSLHHG